MGGQQEGRQRSLQVEQKIGVTSGKAKVEFTAGKAKSRGQGSLLAGQRTGVTVGRTQQRLGVTAGKAKSRGQGSLLAGQRTGVTLGRTQQRLGVTAGRAEDRSHCRENSAEVRGHCWQGRGQGSL
ncbi:unnamed protein product [Staurois parvus]|uniref:Uncharacterized protein n=1 Tax=Staurois parvus TaxID=386267 RepID=A0ABN9DMK0_9NEOB|nr:unnamed protein product [Staurois parvus]